MCHHQTRLAWYPSESPDTIGEYCQRFVLRVAEKCLTGMVI